MSFHDKPSERGARPAPRQSAAPQFRLVPEVVVERLTREADRRIDQQDSTLVVRLLGGRSPAPTRPGMADSTTGATWFDLRRLRARIFDLAE